MRRFFSVTFIAAALLFGNIHAVRADYLYNSFVVPSFSTDYSAWDVFYSSYGGANKPDFAAPFGIYQSASMAGAVNLPANASPSNPFAYWDPANPVITQIGTNTAFLVGPGTTGNIYSFAAPTSYRLDDTTSYSPGVVVFQFQTEGTLADFSSIKLQYTDSLNRVFTVSPGEMLREFQTDNSGIGGLGNRTAVQWNLTGLDIKSFSILWNSASPSNSLQLASLDTAATFASVIPASTSWIASSTAAWSNGANWAGGTSSNENGNVNFTNTSASTAMLDANHVVGDLTFNTVANTSIASPGNFTLTANTGVATTAIATGTYNINSKYQMGAYNLFEIAAGVVNLNGVVSGSYGMEKSGDGTLALAGNNTFTGDVSVNGGTLVLSGTNGYTGLTTVLQGGLVVAADAPSGAPGTLGNSDGKVVVGEDSDLFANVGGASASLVIDGDHVVGRDITLTNGFFSKTLGAQDTSAGATFSGNVNISTSDNLHLRASQASDKLTFGGGITGGVGNGIVVVDGAGIVALSGTAPYNYTGATNILSGTLMVAQNASLASAGTVFVATQGTLQVSGTLAGSGTLDVAGTIGGSGKINRPLTLEAGAIMSLGGSPGALHTMNENWLSGGNFLWKISDASGSAGANPGWDFLDINGTLTLDATADNPFKLVLQSFTRTGNAGLLYNFNPDVSYTWLIATASDGITGFDADAFEVNAADFANAIAGSFNVTDNSGNLYLNYAPVPEPSTVISLFIGGVMLAAMCRRKYFNNKVLR